MIDRALKPNIKDSIQKYCGRYRENEDDRLSDDDQNILDIICQILEAFKHAILSTKSYIATLDNILPTMEFILDTIEQAKVDYADHPFIGPCANSSWAKMDIYYRRTSETPVYIAALILHPSRKWNYIEDNWQHHPD